MTHKQILEQSRKDLKAIYKQAKEKLAKLETGIVAQVGKWYKDPSSDYLVHVTKILGNNNYVEVYGFDSNGNWFNKWDTVVHQLCVEATPQEVEKALIEEAKRIGHPYERYDYNPEENELSGINNGRLESVFCDVHWEQPIDKFAELKEAHKNGAKIQVKCELSGGWGDLPDNYEISWKADEYRIKPEEKPKVGDVCKFWSDDEPGFIVSHYLRGDNGLHTFDGSIYFDHARVITPQQVQELLFGKDPSCPQ